MPGPKVTANIKKADYLKTHVKRLRQARAGRVPSTVDAATARRTKLAERKKKKLAIKLALIQDKKASKMLID
jgi:hypothetical protein